MNNEKYYISRIVCLIVNNGWGRFLSSINSLLSIFAQNLLRVDHIL